MFRQRLSRYALVLAQEVTPPLVTEALHHRGVGFDVGEEDGAERGNVGRASMNWTRTGGVRIRREKVEKLRNHGVDIVGKGNAGLTLKEHNSRIRNGAGKLACERNVDER